MINLLFKQLFTKDPVLNNSHTKPDFALNTDIHSHLLPGIDDGSKSLEDSLMMVKAFKNLGYTKLITTPHVMGDAYRNTSEIILQKKEELEKYLEEQGVEMQIEAAAEYYLDEWMGQKLAAEEKLLSFGKNYLLFETAFVNMPRNFFEFIFDLQTQGYQPVFAHPERYIYLQDKPEILDDILAKGVLLQVNMNSLIGYYGAKAKHLAERIVQKGQVSFLGSDCHKMKHLEELKKFFFSSNAQKLAHSPLLNKEL